MLNPKHTDRNTTGAINKSETKHEESKISQPAWPQNNAICYGKYTEPEDCMQTCSVFEKIGAVLQDGRLETAAALAFRRKQPKLLLSVLNQAQDSSRDTMDRVLKHLVSTFEGDDMKRALEMLRDWNTQSKHSYQAQALLNRILVQHSPKVSRTCSSKDSPFPSQCFPQCYFIRH